MPLLDTKSDIRKVGACMLPCAGCGGVSELQVFRIIDRPRFWAAPAGRRRVRYLAVCTGCGRRYRFDAAKGAALAKGRPAMVFERDITYLPPGRGTAP